MQRRIEEESQKYPLCCINTGTPGLQDPTGPTGETLPTTECACVAQMRNIIEQIISLYPNDNLIIVMESRNNVSGRPGSLLPGPNSNPNAGLFQSVNNQGTPEEAVSLCRIASITITSSTYNDNITYLPDPTTNNDCGQNCENAIRTYLPVGNA